MMRALGLFLVLTTAVGCGVGVRWPARLGVPEPSQFEPRATERGFPAVVLRDLTLIESSRGSAHQTVRQRELLILDPKALATANVITGLPFGAKMVKVRGRTIHDDGRIIPLEQGVIERLTWLQLSELDRRGPEVLLTAFPEAEVGCILQLEWTYVDSGWKLSEEHIVGSKLPVRLARIELVHHSDLEMNVEAHGFSIETPRIDRRQARRVFEAKNIVPQPREVFEAAGSTGGRRLRWSAKAFNSRRYFQRFYESWKDVVASIRGAARERLAPIAFDPVRTSTRTEKVRAVYRSVQDRIRDENRRWRARTSASIPTVWEKAQAGPDDRALVMYQLLRQQRIKARLAVVMPEVPAEDATAFEPASVPHPDFAFGDLVVMVGNEDDRLVLDPSCQRCAVGDVAKGHAGHLALSFEPYSEKEPAFERLPPLPGARGTTRRASVAIEPEGVRVVRARYTLDAVRSRAVRQWLWAQPRSANDVVDRMREELPRSDGGRIVVDANTTPGAPVSFELQDILHSGAPFTFGAHEAWVPVSTLLDTDWMDEILAGSGRRRSDVDLGAVGQWRDTLDVQGPAGWSAASAQPRNIELRIPGALYQRFVERQATGRLRLRQILDIQPHWSANDFPRLRAFLAKVRASMHEELGWFEDVDAPTPDAEVPAEPARPGGPR